MQRSYLKHLEQKQRTKDRRDISAQALRAAGYVPVPRLWVLPNELKEIRLMSKKHEQEINRIRAEAFGDKEKTNE